ncbi:hypothetical protein T459_14372 [Capsicum annuum]|uniref:PRONE domain-containing protein n=1 Tax=Capsicum annuum TaxID=4072 RepID=A0A2G2ZH81_CAPAN|nr:hypothetical protein T459_14372 [Capsicum annuum]
MKERFAKLLLGENVIGGSKGVSTALALSNAITYLADWLYVATDKIPGASDLFLWFPIDYSSVAMGQLCVASDKIPDATDSVIFMVSTDYSSIATDNMAPQRKEIESSPSKGTSTAAQLHPPLYELALQGYLNQKQKIMNTGRRNLSKEMILMLIALPPKS